MATASKITRCLRHHRYIASCNDCRAAHGCRIDARTGGTR